MNENQGHTLTSAGHRPHPVLRVLVPVLIVAGSIVVAVALVKTAPKPKKRAPQERVSIVEVETMKKTSRGIVVRTTGTVVPSRAVTLQSRVAGHVIGVSPNFIPGGLFRAGEVMLQIESADYRLAVTNRQAAVAKAEYDLKVELGMQDVAKHEWEAMRKMTEEAEPGALDRELALREPHLRLAEQNLRAAVAQLEQARLDLARTEVRAPFNAIVRERHANTGSLVSSQTPLADIAGTDEGWIRITVPAGLAHWVTPDAPGTATGALVTVSSVPGIELNRTWKGRVLRRLPDLEPAGRQAQFLVQVENPAAGEQLIPLGAYVHVSIEGPMVSGVFVVPRRAIREGGEVWVMNNERRLDIRRVDVLWADDEIALATAGVEDGEKLVVSDISAPLRGMLLTTVDDMNNKPVPQPDGAKGGHR